VEPFINHRACVQMSNLFSHGTADETITASELTGISPARCTSAAA